MNFKSWLNENDDLDQWYQSVESSILSNPEAQQELQTKGVLTIKTLMKIGFSEPDANYLSREISKRHGNQSTYYKDQQEKYKPLDDDYLYHVTLKPHLNKILRNGLSPNKNPTMKNYGNYSAGKVFLSGLAGLSYWKERVAAHEESNTDNPQGIVVLRIPKSAVSGLEIDQLGTQDSKQPSWYITKPIPANAIEVVR